MTERAEQMNKIAKLLDGLVTAIGRVIAMVFPIPLKFVIVLIEDKPGGGVALVASDFTEHDDVVKSLQAGIMRATDGTMRNSDSLRQYQEPKPASWPFPTEKTND